MKKKIEINLQNLILTWSSLKKKINEFFWKNVADVCSEH